MSNINISDMEFDQYGNLVYKDTGGVKRILNAMNIGNVSYGIDEVLNSFDNNISSSLNYAGTYNSERDSELSEDDKEDHEILRLVKGYLASYLQKVLDDPDSVIEETINKKNEEKIKELIEENRNLKSNISILETKLNELTEILEKNGLTNKAWDPYTTPWWKLWTDNPSSTPYPYYQSYPNTITADNANSKLND